MGTWLSIILGVSVRVFPDEINFESDWLRQIATSQCEWTSSKLLKAWIEQKGWIRENLVTPPIFELEYQFSPVFWLRLKLRLFALLLLRPLDSTLKVNYHFSCVSSLLTADLRLVSLHDHGASSLTKYLAEYKSSLQELILILNFKILPQMIFQRNEEIVIKNH